MLRLLNISSACIVDGDSLVYADTGDEQEPWILFKWIDAEGRDFEYVCRYEDNEEVRAIGSDIWLRSDQSDEEDLRITLLTPMDTQREIGQSTVAKIEVEPTFATCRIVVYYKWAWGDYSGTISLEDGYSHTVEWDDRDVVKPDNSDEIENDLYEALDAHLADLRNTWKVKQANGVWIVSNNGEGYQLKKFHLLEPNAAYLMAEILNEREATL